MLISGIQSLTLTDFPDTVACTVFTLGCNFRCHYCYNSEFVLPEKVKKILPYCIPEDKFFSFLKKRKCKVKGVCVTGGEPTIHKDLPEFLKKIKSKGFLVKLDTNGSNPEIIKKVLDQKLADYIAMDIKTYPDDYENIIAKKGFEKKIIKSKTIIENSNIDFEFRTVIIPKFYTKERNQKLYDFIGKKSKHRILEFTSKNGCLNPEWEKNFVEEL